MSTGGIAAPLILDISPKCCIHGSLLLVTRIGKGSISDAHSGVIPFRIPPKGNPPDPSNKLPKVRLFILHRLCKFGVWDFLTVSLHKYIIGAVGMLNISPQDNRGVLLVQLHCVAYSVGKFTRHQR